MAMKRSTRKTVHTPSGVSQLRSEKTVNESPTNIDILRKHVV